jgi:hypothetical protein
LWGADRARGRFGLILSWRGLEVAPASRVLA